MHPGPHSRPSAPRSALKYFTTAGGARSTPQPFRVRSAACHRRNREKKSPPGHAGRRGRHPAPRDDPRHAGRFLWTSVGDCMHCVGDASSCAPPGGACSRPASRPPHELGGKDSNSGQCDVHVVHRAAVRAMSRQALIAQVGHGEELEEEAVDVLVHTAGIPYSCVALKRGPEEDEDWFCLECRTAGKGPPNTPGERCPLGAFLPQAGQRGGRAALWGGLRRDKTAPGCLSTRSRAATTTRSTTRATSMAGVCGASQPRRNPIPYDARGRPCVRT